MQMPVTKVLASMRMAYSGSKSVTQAVAGKRSKEFWNLFRSAVVGMARSGMQKDVADGKSSELVAKAVDHGGCWPGGSLAPGPPRNGKVAADMVASGNAYSKPCVKSKASHARRGSPPSVWALVALTSGSAEYTDLHLCGALCRAGLCCVHPERMKI